MILRFIIFGMITYSLISIPRNFLSLDYFNLTKINIAKNSKMLESELTTLSKKLYNRNSNYINYKKLKEFLEEDIRVENATIKEIGLGEIEIDIKEKSLHYYVLLKNKIYLLDKNLEIFGNMSEKKKKSVPLIVANNIDEIKDMGNILNSLEDINVFKAVSQIYKVDENDFRIVLKDGVEIKVNREIDFTKYKIFDIFYFAIKKTKKILYVDLRFEDYIIKYVGDVKNGE